VLAGRLRRDRRSDAHHSAEPSRRHECPYQL